MSLILGAKVNSATGGTISSITGYTVHTFSSSGTFTANTSGFVEVLVVGAGGNAVGPAQAGGGAGAGSVLYSKFIPVSAGVGYTVTVGGPPGGQTIFYYGGPTAPGTYILAPGGANAGAYGANGGSNPSGSGGGAGGQVSSPAFLYGFIGGNGAGVVGYGFPGAPTQIYVSSGGGGGGAGGAAPSHSPGFNSPGGPGLTYTISGSSVTYGIGGWSVYNQNSGTSNPSAFGNGGSANYPGPVPYNAGNPGGVIIRYLA